MKKILVTLVFIVFSFAGKIEFELNKNSAIKFYNYTCAVKETLQLQYMLKKILSNEDFVNYSTLIEQGDVKVYTIDLLKRIYSIVNDKNFYNSVKDEKGSYYLDLSRELIAEIQKTASNAEFYYTADKIIKYADKMKRSKNMKSFRIMKKELYLLIDKYIRDLKKVRVDGKSIDLLSKINAYLKNNINK
ncbi:hypothetical protein [Nautilia lithotrophica]